MYKRTNLIVIILCSVLLSCPALAQDSGGEPAVDAKADKVLRQMSEYMNTLEQFSIHGESSVDTMLATGQKIQLGDVPLMY